MHSIRDIVEKIKAFVRGRTSRLRVIPDDIFLGLIVILVAFGSFGLGRLSKIEGVKTPIRIEGAPGAAISMSKEGILQQNTTQAASIMDTQPNQLVASKSGKKYYYAWCTGVQKIAEANRIYFTSKTEAEARGYAASATCKGL